MLNRMATKISTTQVFRQRTPLVLAAVSAVTGVTLLVSLARDWAGNPQPLFLAWVLLALALVWSVFVRPAVLLDHEGVTVRSVVRDVHIPWGRVTDVESRWNLKVFAGDRGYNAWAISSQVERPERVSGGLFGMLSPRGLDTYATANARPSTPAPKVTAAMVARSIEQARQEYDDAVARRAHPAALDAPVRVTWAPLVVAILLLPAIAVVALSLT
jgi:Bacterial PH domain